VLWNTLTGTEVGKPLDEPDKSPFRSVAFSPNGAILAAGDDGGGVTLWRTSDRRPIGRLLVDSKPRNRSVRSVAFSPDGTVLATGAEDGSVTLWNVASGDQVRRFDDHSQVLSLGFSHDGESLATGDSNGAIVTWNLTTGTASSLPTASGSQVYSLAFSSDDATLAAANDNASVTVLPSIVARDTTQELAASLCRRVTGNLTQAEWNRYVGRSPYQTVCPAY
jgi:WD40 repeat protein